MATIKWVSDPMHSKVQFRVKHLIIMTMTGYFRNFNIEAATSNDKFTDAERIVFTADVNSISTNNEQRDTHLKSADFF